MVDTKTSSDLNVLNELTLFEPYPKLPKQMNKKVLVLNARGTKFEVMIGSLARVPNSRLGQISEIIEKPKKHNADLDKLNGLCDRYSEDFNEIYFNKDSTVLSSILKFYENDPSQEKKIHLSLLNACAVELAADFEYWKIEYHDYLDLCCLRKFRSSLNLMQSEKKSQQKIIDEINFKENFGKYFFPKVREAIWLIMEKPSSSIWAKVNFYFSVFYLYY
jgi:hypothetical protein